MKYLCKSQLKDGRPVSLREAYPPDASALNELVSQIINSSHYTLTTSAELDPSTEAQADRIHEFQKGKGSLIILAECDGQLIGTLDFKNNSKVRIRHSGEFGMGVLPAYRGLGLGKLLLQELLRWGEANATIEKICLGVFAENTAAVQLYRNLGFVEEGRLIKAIKTAPGKYADEIRMYKWV